jgi:hypothetical protein
MVVVSCEGFWEGGREKGLALLLRRCKRGRKLEVI